LTRRRLIARGGLIAGGVLASSRAIRAQVTDLRGFDPLWRSAEDAIRAFFGDVRYARDGMALDLPDYADAGGAVPLTLAIDCAMTQGDHPRVVHVVAHKNPTPHVLSVWLRPENGRAEFATRIRLESSQTVTAVAQMSDGRHLRVDRDVAVSFGACAQIGEGSNDDVVAFQPRSRVSVPAQARRGEIVPIRAVISHPMETGLRFGSAEEWVRQRIISRFTCVYGGVDLFRARLYPAIATNPYFQFYARASVSGALEFDWYDTLDLTFTNRAEITVF
jgi:predicted secreted protein